MKSFLKILVIILALVGQGKLYAQNLVLNPSFEENNYIYSESNFRLPQLSECISWRGGGHYLLQCESCGKRKGFLPNAIGYQFPKSGNACIALVSWIKSQPYARGQITGNLIKPLIKDSIYKVKVFVNLGEDNNMPIIITGNRLGVFLGRDSMPLKFDPNMIQIQNNPNRFLDDTLGWMEISGIIKAKGGEKFITIKNFWSENETSYKIVYGSDNGNINYGVFYLIEDVSVTQVIPYLGKDTVICSGNSITLKSKGDKSDSIFWQDGSRDDNFLVTKSGKYWVEAWHSGYKVSDTIYIKPQYEVNLGTDQKLCEGQTYTFTLPENGANYEWSDGSTNHTYTVNQSGKYWVKAQKYGCTAYDTAEVVFQQPLAVNHLPKDTFICENRSLMIDLQKLDSEVIWQDGSTSNQYQIDNEGTYMLTLKNACGSLQHSFYVTEKYCDCNLHIPNAFTPNFDAVNDGFNISTDCVFGSYNLSVYNRWGVQIFSTDDLAQSWDGNFKGKSCTQDVYYYTLNAVSDNGESFSQRKMFHLVK